MSSISGFGYFTDTYSEKLTQDALHQFGHAPMHLESPGEWFRLATAVFLTVGGWRFWASLAMLLTTVGGLEWVRGTKVTALVFFGVHVATLVLEYLLVLMPLSYLEYPLADVMHTAHDVGPSAGYYSCLGALLGGIYFRGQRLAILAVLMWLTVRLGMSLELPEGWSDSLPADLAHLIAFPLGWATIAFIQSRWWQQ